MRLRLDGRGRALLRLVPRTNPYSLAELLLMALLAAQGARLIWAVVTPVDPLGDWRPRQAIVPADAQALIAGFDPFFRSAPQAGPAAVTSLQLTLFGIRLDGASGRGGAIIAGPDKVQNSWSVGDEIAPGVRLTAVAFDHVTLDRGGRSEDLYLDQSGGGSAPGIATSAPAAPGGLGPSPDDPAVSAVPYAGGGASVSAGALRSDIGFIPRVDGGRVSGLAVRSQGGGAAFRRIGLRDGDVVTAIGGQPVTGAGDIDRLAAQLPAGGTVSITVERGTATLSIPLAITGP